MIMETNSELVMEGRFPDFLIIGAMKCGTSSLHDYIGEHPDVFMSSPKELHFFDNANYDPERIPWYKAQFSSNKKICGASPQNYTKCHNKYYQGIAQRVYKHMPNVKLIYIVRDPLKRIQSHIIENYYGEPLSDLNYNIKSGHYAKTSMYAMQLKEYLRFFKQNQILIISLEELVKEKLKTMNTVFQFLELNELTDEKSFDFVRNAKEMKSCPNWFAQTYFYKGINKVSPRFIQTLITNPFLKKWIFQKRLDRLLQHVEVSVYGNQLKEDVTLFRKLSGKPFKEWSI
jgi:hypothetical protein